MTDFSSKGKEKYQAAYAMQTAQAVGTHLAAYIDRFAIAGSLRRGKPWVHDVDLVCIPKIVMMPARRPTLFLTQEPVNQVGLKLLKFNDEHVITDLVIGEKLARFTWIESGVPVDIYFADESTWHTILLIRTGSKEHNFCLCKIAAAMGGRLHADGRGLELSDGTFAKITSEEDIFQLLGTAFRKPGER